MSHSKIMEKQWDVECAYDDNSAVIGMYKRAGVKAKRVQLHEVQL